MLLNQPRTGFRIASAQSMDGVARMLAFFLGREPHISANRNNGAVAGVSPDVGGVIRANGKSESRLVFESCAHLRAVANLFETRLDGTLRVNWRTDMVLCKVRLLLLLITSPLLADTAFDAPGNANPIVPGYFADPTLKKFGGTWYLYATTDGNGGGRGPAQVWISNDFVNWTLVPMNWPTTPYYWAPDVIRRPDGQYYLYYNQPCVTFAGVSDSPIGPWKPLTQPDGVVIPDQTVRNVITLDAQSFEDNDGGVYMFWGTWGIFPNSGCGIGKLNADMKSFSKLGKIPNTQAKDFFEAPFMIERNGVYYLMYSSGSCHDDSYRVQYAVSNKPDGEFQMGANNPILASNSDRTVHGPGHHSVVREGDDYYMCYHRHDIPVTPNGMHRQVCVDRMLFDGESIRKIEPTHKGVGSLGAKVESAPNLAFGKKVTASSFYRDALRKHDFKPEYAVDDNNATLWRPSDNRMGHWLMVDLGNSQRVRRTQTQFEYATWYYQYVIEASTDGQSWKTFADRRESTRWGSPMVDTGDVEARYLRITVTGVEYPGLFGAIWNFKAFANALEDPLQKLADKAFDEIVKPRQKPVATAASPRGLLVHLDAADLESGSAISTWKNHGALGGEFVAAGARPMVSMAAGRKAVRFSGRQLLKGSVPAPRTLAGNNSFTVAAWALNPQIAESECIVSWAGRGGPDGTTAQIGYGFHRGFGAVGHWGFADMGFRGGAPKAGAWHHIAVVFDGVTEKIYVDGQLNAQSTKMLMMHEGRPIYIGASEPNTEYFDGYLASLRMYDTPLSQADIRKLAVNEPQSDVLVHLDSARLDYGTLIEWTNNGLVDEPARSADKPPTVEDVNGRIALSFKAGQFVDLQLPVEMPIKQHTVIAAVLLASGEQEQCLLELADKSGGIQRYSPGLPQGYSDDPPKWHLLAYVNDGSKSRYYFDGAPAAELPSVVRIENLHRFRLGAPASTRMPGKPFNGAVSHVELLRTALSAEQIAAVYQAWKSQWQAPAPSPAEFATAPVAIAPWAAALCARPSASPYGAVEYLFAEATGQGRSSGWIAEPTYLDHGLKHDATYRYTLKTRDSLGNVSRSSEPAQVVTDSSRFELLVNALDRPRDFLADGTAGSVWDGLVGKSPNSSADVIAVKDGALRIQSTNTSWDGGGKRGPFLYKLVKGDFVAEVKIADFPGLATRQVQGNHDAGLMVRLPTADDKENLVQIGFFPAYDVGNMWTSLGRGGRPQQGNRLAWDAHRWLQIERRGEAFHLRTSPDGKRWFEMPGSPVVRREFASQPLQLGFYHATYGNITGAVVFEDFRMAMRK